MKGTPQIELIGADVAHEIDRQRVLVRDVDWRICLGDWWVVCGSAASGKTSLLCAAAGLNKPVRGSIRIFGEDLAFASEARQTAWRREIGFVFENGGRLLGRLSVAENVALPLQYHDDLDASDVRERVEALLALAGIEALADTEPSRLSVGMRQRAALLRSLALPIRVLFLDDPLRGVPPSDIRWWVRFLRELRARRAASGEPFALVVSAYDFTPWLEDADRFAVVEDGRFRVLADVAAAAGHGEDLLRESSPGAGA